MTSISSRKWQIDNKIPIEPVITINLDNKYIILQYITTKWTLLWNKDITECIRDRIQISEHFQGCNQDKSIQQINSLQKLLIMFSFQVFKFWINMRILVCCMYVSTTKCNASRRLSSHQKHNYPKKGRKYK